MYAGRRRRDQPLLHLILLGLSRREPQGLGCGRNAENNNVRADVEKVHRDLVFVGNYTGYRIRKCRLMIADANLPLRCICDRVRGVAHEVSLSASFRFVCYCKDCQAFARFLDRPDVLDAAGGADIFRMSPARVQITAGADALRCLCLREKTRVMRWYADCCRTPFANTAASPHFPIVALIHSFIDAEAIGRSRDEMLGPPLCGIYERSAIGPLPLNAPASPSVGVFISRASKMFGWWMRGLARPNPFFDDQTNAPISPPRVLTPSERATLERGDA
jgi:hypothetical protein